MSTKTPQDSAAAERAAVRLRKKRELDRKSQRMARDRTKARLAYLEKIAEEVQQRDESGITASLMNQISELQKERDSLKRILQDVASMTKSYQDSGNERKSQPDVSKSQDEGCSHEDTFDAIANSDTPCQWPTFDSTTLEHTSNDFSLNLQENQCYDGRNDISDGVVLSAFMPSIPTPSTINTYTHNTHGNAGLSMNLESNTVSQIFSAEGFQNEVGVWQSSDPIVPLDQSCDCSTPTQNTTPLRKKNLWRFANEVLSASQDSAIRGAIILEDPLFHETIPIRAVADGWDSLGSMLTRYPSWGILKQIDEEIFYCCGKVERLAIMLYMFQLLQSHVTCAPERFAKLPAWYTNRPSQLLLPHSCAIDYFCWPGIRERFVFSQHRYCSNLFWDLFRSCFRILWPYEFRDCYSRNTETGLYTVSPLFETRLRDIKCWTMGPEIFNHFPEFYSDIPAIDQMPPRISDSSRLEFEDRGDVDEDSEVIRQVVAR